MRFAMAPLLIHDEHVPSTVREAVRAAYEAAPHRRLQMLEQAARALHAATDLDCHDVRELFDLSS
jgi:hypothetical protein